MSERLYSLLLQLYPRAFRDRYAEEMLRLFRDRLRDEPAARVWIDVLRDAVVSIPRQHVVREPHPLYPPSAAPLRAAYAAVVRALIVSAVLGEWAAFLVGASTGVAMPGRVGELSALLVRQPGGWLLSGLILVVWVVTMRSARRASRTVKTYRADASGDAVTVACDGMAPLTLQRSEVIGLREHEKIGLRIQSVDPARDLWVPVRTASYQSIKKRLSEWAPLTVAPSPAANPRQLAVLYALAVFIPLKLAGFVVGALLVCVAFALASRDRRAKRTLLCLGPVAILAARWFL